MPATVSSASSTDRPAAPGTPDAPSPSRDVNTRLLSGTGRGILVVMTTNAALRETTRRVVRSAMRSMMSMMMMPMMHRQPGL